MGLASSSLEALENAVAERVYPKVPVDIRTVINYWPVDGWSTAAEVVEQATPGDLIEFRRTGYSHWAVYIGDGWVVNYGRKEPSPELVQRERLLDVSGRDKCRINNLCQAASSINLSSLDSSEIVRRASARIGERSPYNLVNHNCEVFATECRYGEGFTCQPTEAIITAGHLVGGGALGYEAGKQAVASGRWTEEEVADYLYDSWSNSAMY